MPLSISLFRCQRYGRHSWETGDIKFLEDYLYVLFKAYSDFAFEEITSKSLFLSYFKEKRIYYKEHKHTIKTRVVIDTSTDDKGIIVAIDGIEKCFVKLGFTHYRISSAHTKSIPTSVVDWKEKCELYQVHGNHFVPFISENKL